MTHWAGQLRLGSIALLLGLAHSPAVEPGGTATISPSPSSRHHSMRRVVVDDRVHMLAPGIVSLNRKEDHQAVISKDGYEPKTIQSA